MSWRGVIRSVFVTVDEGAVIGSGERRDEVVAAKARKQRQNGAEDPDAIPGVHFMTPEEALAFFDRKARETLGISGDEFLRRWDAGEYQPVPDTREGQKIGRLVMLFPCAGRKIP
jgi:hypothetical protein